jgi:hypothetical protein
MAFGEPHWRGSQPAVTLVDEVDDWWPAMSEDSEDPKSSWDTDDPCSAGHVCGEPIEYVDGVFAASCLMCGARVLLSGVPGGVTLMRSKALLQRFLKLRDEDSAQCSNPIQLANASGMLEELSGLVIKLAHERVKMDEIGKLLDYCKVIVHQLESAKEDE